MLWIAIGGLMISIMVNAVLISRWSGRLETVQKSHAEIIERHEKAHDFHYKQARDHEDNDQRHFADTDMHWNRRERDWLNVRFQELTDRLVRIENLIRENK